MRSWTIALDIIVEYWEWLCIFFGVKCKCVASNPKDRE